MAGQECKDRNSERKSLDYKVIGTILKKCIFLNSWNAVLTLLAMLTTAAYACNPAHIISCPTCFLSQRVSKFHLASSGLTEP